MSELVANCPRCKANKMTFDLYIEVMVSIEYSWQHWVEAFCVCRNCKRPTIFLLSQKEVGHRDYFEEGLSKLKVSVNRVAEVKRFISLQDHAAESPPEHLPENINSIFKEGASCLAIGCNNAAATMFRLCLDLATQSLLPNSAEGLNNQVKRNLGLRLPWLFQNNLLPEALKELSSCIKDDGNDGAHEGTLKAEDAEDILDFTYILLERLYTEPKRLELAAIRRQSRKSKST